MFVCGIVRFKLRIIWLRRWGHAGSGKCILEGLRTEISRSEEQSNGSKGDYSAPRGLDTYCCEVLRLQFTGPFHSSRSWAPSELSSTDVGVLTAKLAKNLSMSSQSYGRGEENWVMKESVANRLGLQS